MNLADDEKPIKEPFWKLEEFHEAKIVKAVLKRRFPSAYLILTEALESADPFDIVYPGNPDEYSDVVQEIIVLLAPVSGDLGKLTERQVDEIVRDGLARRFGEEPDEVRVREAVRLIGQKAKSL
ncbi:hypothetical protein [Actinophytocola sediminis]